MNTEIIFLGNMTKNKNLTRAKKAIIYGCIFLVISLFTRSCNNSADCKNEAILTAENLIWTRPDSTIAILEGLDTVFLTENDKMMWFLLHEHALMRLTQQPAPDSIIDRVIAYFGSHDVKRYLCEAFYIKGTSYFLKMDYFEAMKCLKEAEYLIPTLDEDEPYAGMIYYMLGQVSENDYLYNIAQSYYLDAVPYFRAIEDHLRLSTCYRDIARTKSWSSLYHEANAYFDSAIYESTLLDYPLLTLEIQLQKELSSPSEDSLRVFQLSKTMCDKYGLTRYAFRITEWYMKREQQDSAYIYMSLMPQDTIFNIWWKDNYRYVYSQFLDYTGNSQEAYNELKIGYQDLYNQLLSDAKVRTYAIARRYDLEREQEKTLRLTITRQRLWITIAMSAVILMLIVGIASGIFIRQRHREELNRQQKEKAEMERDREAAKRWKAEAEKQEALVREEAKAAEIRILEQNQEIDRINIENLHNSLREQQQQLHTLFADRVQFIAKLKREKEIYHRTMPGWLAEMLERLTLTHPEEWERFEHEFQKIFGDILIEIQKQHPNLTKEDLRFLSLYIVGLDNETIGILLQQELRTLWNRKQKVRNRLKTDNLDEWIEREVIEQVISRRMEEKNKRS